MFETPVIVNGNAGRVVLADFYTPFGQQNQSIAALGIKGIFPEIPFQVMIANVSRPIINLENH